jgi:hypothetical protein
MAQMERYPDIIGWDGLGQVHTYVDGDEESLKGLNIGDLVKKLVMPNYGQSSFGEYVKKTTSPVKKFLKAFGHTGIPTSYFGNTYVINKKLTFSNKTNLVYFKAGELVQQYRRNQTPLNPQRHQNPSTSANQDTSGGLFGNWRPFR